MKNEEMPTIIKDEIMERDTTEWVRLLDINT